jgi:2'-5' RNA ligase
MFATGPTSAVIVRVTVPPGIERLRRRWDWAASVGVPAHVTVLFPFLAPSDLASSARRDLASIAADTVPFEVIFASVGRFPNVVYLVPEPSGPFARLTEAVFAKFPDFPPYEGAFEEVIPHLTVAESASAPHDEIAREATALLPIHQRITTLEVLVEGAEGRWHGHWRLPLGRVKR